MNSGTKVPAKLFPTLPPEELARIAAEFTWFHAIDCGSFQTSGRFEPGKPQNGTLYGVFDLVQKMDLRGRTCLDIGTADGLLGFGMKTLGAEKVVAADTYRLKSFLLARAALGLDIEYHPKLQIKDLLSAFQPASFDLIACAGIIYHMLNPFSALLVCRQLIREGGYFVVETAFATDNDTAAMIFNPVAELNPEKYTYWLPTRSALEGMMRMAGFEIVATRTIRDLPRITVLGRAVRPGKITGRSPMLQRMHEVDFCDHEFRIEDLFANPRETSRISMLPVSPFEEIDHFKWAGTFPHHPRNLPNAKGRTRWESEKRNY
jgi:2-polyprenyl-3-methyl-5-hydroxy-6-metoxy-1,4-benzoquinol methylase